MNKTLTYEELLFEIMRMQHSLSDSLVKLEKENIWTS